VSFIESIIMTHTTRQQANRLIAHRRCKRIKLRTKIMRRANFLAGCQAQAVETIEITNLAQAVLIV